MEQVVTKRSDLFIEYRKCAKFQTFQARFAMCGNFALQFYEGPLPIAAFTLHNHPHRNTNSRLQEGREAELFERSTQKKS